MKKSLFILFLFVYGITFSQVEDAWVYFKDKPNSEIYLNNPTSMLTQRAIERRTNQNIPLDILDVPIFQSYIDQVTTSTGITVKAKSKWLNCLHVRGSKSDIDLLKSLSFVDRVDFANQLFNVAKLSSNKKISNQTMPKTNKIYESKVNFDYGNSFNQIQMLNGHLLHQLNYTGSGKIIAVLDSGFPGVDTAQPFQRLINNNLILGGYNFVNKSNNFYTGDSHGTSVLSFMGGYKEGQLIGTAPDASYYLFITEDVASENPVEESNWVEAAEEADRLGVDIISTSLGYFGYDNPNYSHTYSDMTGNSNFASKGANIAFDKGIIVLASAGNEGASIEPHIGTPAEAKNVIAVGSVNSDETYSSTSSIGPSYDNRVKPDIMAQGVRSYYSTSSGTITNSGSGTSFSCPIAAGMMACLWQALPTKTSQELKQLILQSSDRYLNPTHQLGYGIPDFNLALSNGLSRASYSEFDYVMYPNPSNDEVTFTLPSNSKSGWVTIYSNLGQKVMKEEIPSQMPKIALKTLTKGIYFYKIEIDGFLKTGKMVKH